MMNFTKKCLASLEEASITIGLKPFKFIEKHGKNENYLYTQLDIKGPKVDIYIYSDEIGCELDGKVWNIFEKYDYSSEDELIQKFVDYLIHVVFNKNKKEFIDAILAWAEALSGEISIEHSFSINEESIYMRPFKKDSSLLEIRADGSKFSVHFGSGFGLNKLDLDLKLALDICASIRSGNVEEYIWCLGKHIIRAEGRLNIEEDIYYWKSRENVLLHIFSCFLRKEKIHYTSWF